MKNPLSVKKRPEPTHPHKASSPTDFFLPPLPIWLFLLLLLLSPVSQAFAQHAVDSEAWIQLRLMYRENIPATTIEEDIAALGGSDTRKAGPRLIDRGPNVLPAVHEAFRKKDVSPRQALALLQVMQALADKSSVPILLELLTKYPSNPLRRGMLLTLAMLPVTEEAFVFNAKLADDQEEPWRTRRMAYTWFGLHRDPRGRPFAEALRDDPDPERRITALYVLAQLGEPSALEPVSQILKQGPPSSYRDVLLLSLAELTTPEDFVLRAPASLEWSGGYKHSLLYARYRNAGTDDKTSICQDLLRSSYPGHLGVAVRCLLESGHADDLRPHAALSLETPGRDAMIRNEIRKAGWQIIDTDEEFRIIAPGS